MISMHDGLVLYTTPSIVTALGYLKDAWIGRSFIDYVHPKDKNTLADQISAIASPQEERSKGTLYLKFISDGYLYKKRSLALRNYVFLLATDVFNNNYIYIF